MFLLSMKQQPIRQAQTGFPYTVPVLTALQKIEFTTPITFLVGENGSGKSTLLEVLACAIGSTTVGSISIDRDETLADVRAYADRHIKLAWRKRTQRGFFMRAEDFFGYAKRMAQIKADMLAELQRVEAEYGPESSYAKSLARMPFARELHAMEASYGDGLDANSHGEGFFKLFQRRFTGAGVYLLDEPEAPLSPNRQLTLLSMLKQMVDEGAQFIIATHSPILMAYPDATILQCDADGVQAVAYGDLEHVNVMRSFLNNPAAYLRHLLAD